MSEDSGGGTHSAEGHKMSAKTLSSSANAAPFVPESGFPRTGESAGEERPGVYQRRAASALGFSADAPEFVPSRKGGEFRWTFEGMLMLRDVRLVLCAGGGDLGRGRVQRWGTGLCWVGYGGICVMQNLWCIGR